MSPTDERPDAGLPTADLQDVAVPVLNVDVDAPLVQRAAGVIKKPSRCWWSSTAAASSG